MKRNIGLLCVALMAIFVVWAVYTWWFSPTRILVVNAADAQQADFILNNDSRHIHIECTETEGLQDVGSYDAIILYGRNLYLNDEQTAMLQKAGNKGTVVFTKNARPSNPQISLNISEAQQDTLKQYFDFGNHHNIRNGLRYLRHLTTPQRLYDQDYDPPAELPVNMFYHREYGRYFKNSDEIKAYLQEKGLYHEGGPAIALIAGLQFPMEGNRAHIDTLITLLSEQGFNVYPLAASGKAKERMLRTLHPDAVVNLAVGRLGNDTLINWLNQENILLFNPFPLATDHTDWLDDSKPLSTGSLNARVVIPEIDGALAPFCIATRNSGQGGYLTYTPEMERIKAFLKNMQKQIALRTMPNAQKHIAIAYFKHPGKDALLASGLEVIPSLYAFLQRLKAEGYDVSGLPAGLNEFARLIKTEGVVLGSYARGAQEEYMRQGHPVWIDKHTYEQWVQETLTSEKYREVVERYGDAPGSLLSKGDSIAVACLRFGNILVFPQPRPALGDDGFKLVHGAKVAPPHSYIAPYLYMLHGFQADVLIHFGTHGSLEFTPGKQAALSEYDWAEALTGSLPHFYFYTTGNIGEAVIAKRRTHAELVTYLTPPYAESGLSQKLQPLLSLIHEAIEHGEGDNRLALQVKQAVVKAGYHRDLGLDSLLDKGYTIEELEQLDAHLEEVANEKMQGAYRTLGTPYDRQELIQTTLAMSADPLAYETAKADRDQGKITTDQLHDKAFIAHHYLQQAKRYLTAMLQNPPADSSALPAALRPAWMYRKQLLLSAKEEMDRMVAALHGDRIHPAAGGDPVLNPNVLPMGRNMYGINPENTPTEQAWESGKQLAEETLEKYKASHGEYPRKVSYTFWAGEFISTQGATVAQALWMLGVEPVRDGMGRIDDLRLVPSSELGRPRINILVQVSGQLRDMAGSRLQMITDAVKLAAGAEADEYPNYVAEGNLEQERSLAEKGLSPKRARELASMRVFGPLNNGYSTGIMGYIEHSGEWNDETEIAQGYLNNMGAAYGDEASWGAFEKELLPAALQGTDVLVQPRQSNTWGPVSLDHVYEFTGGLSLAVKTVTGKEPESYMADYRNRHNHRLQDTREAIAVENRATILNPTYVKERMKGGEGTAEQFGKVFRNIFGWNVTRPASLDKHLYDDLYSLYIADEQHLGMHEYFQQTDPAAYQTMTAVMLESARKGYWKPTEEQLQTTASLHAQLTQESGAACTEFVCDNTQLQSFIASQLDATQQEAYQQKMADVKENTSGQREMILKQQNQSLNQTGQDNDTWSGTLIAIGVAIALAVIILIRLRRGREES